MFYDRRIERAAVEAEQEREVTIAAKRQKLDSTQPEPNHADTISLLFRMPDGSRKERNFRKQDTVQDMYDFVDVALADMGNQMWESGTYEIVFRIH